jgi:hypothetical protein
MNPSPSFYRQFNGYTLGLVGAILAMGGLWALGRGVVARLTLRGLPGEERADRLSSFNSTVLARLLLVIYIVYPGVSVAGAARARALFAC